jgi:serine/threonine protein phosphatase PrpC
MTLHIEHAAATHVGRRENNEDAFCVEPALRLFAVADGMGGYEGGEVASHVAVDTLRDFFARERDDRESTWPFGLDRRLTVDENRLQMGVRLAHAEVAARKSGRLALMGSTVAALTIDGDEAIVCHVGDSRVYRRRGNVLEQLTRDHSLYAELQAAGTPLPAKEECSFGNVITRALGMDPAPRPDLRREPLVPGDVYLLCTDGLTERLPEARITQLVSLPPARAARALVDEAYAAGGRDNITVVVVAVH